jgi:hypothetical protein
MRTNVKQALPEVVLARILEAFGQELIEASDEEIMEAAKELGMDPHMKGSAAYAGLIFPAKWQLSDFFDVEAAQQRFAGETAKQNAKAISTDLKSKVRGTRRSGISMDGKGSGGK